MPAEWASFDRGFLSNFHYFIAVVLVDGTPVSAGALAGFVGGSVRGVQASTSGPNLFFLTVWADGAGEAVSFKYSADGVAMLELAELCWATRLCLWQLPFISSSVHFSFKRFGK